MRQSKLQSCHLLNWVLSHQISKHSVRKDQVQTDRFDFTTITQKTLATKDIHKQK